VSGPFSGLPDDFDPTFTDASEFDPRRSRRHAIGRVFAVLCLLATVSGLVFLAILLIDVWGDGGHRLSWSFIRNYPSRIAERAGILPALVGSLWILGVTAVVAFPIGVGTAIWLEEYAPASGWTRLIQLNIANLAGVPAIVYGMLGLAAFVRWMSLGRSVLAGGLTLALLILPVIIIAAQEAIRAVPSSIRMGALALGATRWQTIRTQVLPMALPGILTGTILALSRAIGEAAPLLLVGAAAFVPFLPKRLGDEFTALPIQIFNWASRPQEEFHQLAAAAILVLLLVLLLMNATAVIIRERSAGGRP